jgi:hypothetical protein
MPIAISAREGRRGCLGRTARASEPSVRASSSSSSPGANDLKPGDIDDLDQKFTCQALNLLPRRPIQDRRLVERKPGRCPADCQPNRCASAIKINAGAGTGAAISSSTETGPSLSARVRERSLMLAIPYAKRSRTGLEKTE